MRIYLAFSMSNGVGPLAKLLSNIKGRYNWRRRAPCWLNSPAVIATDTRRCASPKGRTPNVVRSIPIRRCRSIGRVRCMRRVRVGMYRRVRIVVRGKRGQRRCLGRWVVVNGRKVAKTCARRGDLTRWIIIARVPKGRQGRVRRCDARVIVISRCYAGVRTTARRGKVPCKVLPVNRLVVKVVSGGEIISGLA